MHTAPEEASARERLLNVAERLFAESGYDRVSVRAVNTAAGMNPAAVHYHFGSKDDLVVALLEDRLSPLWDDRLAVVTERDEHGFAPTVAELVDVVLAPLTGLVAEAGGRSLLRLLARFVLGRTRVAWTARWFDLRPWAALLCSARPELSEREAARRWLLAFDLLLHTLGAPLADDPPAGDPPGGRVPVETLRAFVTAGLEAP